MGNGILVQLCATSQNGLRLRQSLTKLAVEIAWFIYELMSRYGAFSVAISDQGLFLILP